jgi:hypothetical protein
MSGMFKARDWTMEQAPTFIRSVAGMNNQSVENIAACACLGWTAREQSQFVERLLAIASAVASHQAGQR